MVVIKKAREYLRRDPALALYVFCEILVAMCTIKTDKVQKAPYTAIYILKILFNSVREKRRISLEILNCSVLLESASCQRIKRGPKI